MYHLRIGYVFRGMVWVWLGGEYELVLEVDGLGVGVFGAQFDDLDA